MIIKLKGKSVGIPLVKAGGIKKFTGLMFRSRNTSSLLFEFKKEAGIHSFFVFFPFLAVWLNGKKEVVEFSIVKPFTPYVISKKKPNYLIEIPVNKKNQPILALFVGKKKDLNTQAHKYGNKKRQKGGLKWAK